MIQDQNISLIMTLGMQTIVLNGIQFPTFQESDGCPAGTLGNLFLGLNPSWCTEY